MFSRLNARICWDCSRRYLQNERKHFAVRTADIFRAKTEYNNEENKNRRGGAAHERNHPKDGTAQIQDL